jgi:STE24 endopeptidase
MHRGAVPAPFAHRIAWPPTRRRPTTPWPRPGWAAALALSTAVLLGWTLLGGLDALHQLAADPWAPAWQQLALLAGFALISA